MFTLLMLTFRSSDGINQKLPLILKLPPQMINMVFTTFEILSSICQKRISIKTCVQLAQFAETEKGSGFLQSQHTENCRCLKPWTSSNSKCGIQTYFRFWCISFGFPPNPHSSPLCIERVRKKPPPSFCKKILWFQEPMNRRKKPLTGRSRY